MLINNRSSHQRCSVRKSVLRNFTKFTGKHLCQSLFLNEVEIFLNEIKLQATSGGLLSLNFDDTLIKN